MITLVESEQRYTVSNEQKEFICVTRFLDGSVTVTNPSACRFVFEHSDPQRVRRIAQLILEGIDKSSPSSPAA